MRYLSQMAGVAALFAATLALNANQLNINTPQGYNSLDASGTALLDSADGPWTFALGSFKSSFTPDASNFSEWDDNWVQAWTAPLITAGPPTQIGRVNSTQGYLVDALVGETAYVFGYNTLDVSADNAQWLLITNEDWIFPPIDPLALEAAVNWSFAEAGTAAVFGSISDSGMQFQAIPEPSTYALIFGLGILGFLGYRRVRK